jgi:hypothetical protein
MAPSVGQWPALPPGPQPYGLLPPGNTQQLAYPGVTARSYGQWPALPPGPQPFGLLPPPYPQVTYIGPVTPSNFANATAAASQPGPRRYRGQSFSKVRQLLN